MGGTVGTAWTRTAGVLALAALAATAAVPAAVPAATPPADEWSVTSGGWVSGDVTYVSSILEETGGAVDSVLHDGLLYVTTWDSFSIYDVSDPLDPDQLSTRPLGPSLYNEQPQTNGEILLLSRDVQYIPPTEHAREGAELEIWDVSDPADPQPLSTYQARLVDTFVAERDHLWTCVLDCTYAYSAGGTILDLTDPSAPVHAGRWTDVAPHRDNRMHHVGEVAPGIVLTGGLPMYVLDVRDDPTQPVVLGSFEPATSLTPPLVEEPVEVPDRVHNPETLPARSAWPDGLLGRLAIVTTETPLWGSCDERSGDVQTFVTPPVPQGQEPQFEPADRYALHANGTFTDGSPPTNVWGCSAYGLDVHPAFGAQGGSAAVAFFEHGVRVLDVDARGKIRERGGFLPLGGSSARPQWITDDILYVVDLNRGIDILRFG